MTIAILGTGSMGSGLARLALEAGYDVVLGSRDAGKAADVARSIGGKAKGGDLASATSQTEIIVLAVPYHSAAETLKAAGSLEGKIIVDITNPVTPDYMALTVGHTTSAAEEIQKLAPRARVVKAFNTIFAQLLSREAQARQNQIQVFTATDDDAARDGVGSFISRLGFTPVAAGPLSNARFLEPLGELNIHFGYALGWGTAITPAWIKLPN